MSFSNAQVGLPRAGSLLQVTDGFGNTYANVAQLTVGGMSGTLVTANALGGGLNNLTLAGSPEYLTTLTSAQILSASGGITIVPAFGASSAVVVVNSWYANVAGASAYASGVGGLFYGTSGGPAADLGDKSVFRSASGAFTLSGPVSNVSGLLSGYVNTAVVYATTSSYVSGNGTGYVNVLWMPITV